MKKTIAANELMRGRVRVMERNADELDDLRRRFLERKETLRTLAVGLRAEHHSIYVRRRLDGLLSALKQLDGLNQKEASVFRDVEKYIGRLLRTDLVDHFSRSLHRRVEKIARSEVGPRIRTDILRGPLWYRLRVGDLHLAVFGRLRRFQRTDRPVRISMRPGSNKRLRVFPQMPTPGASSYRSHSYLAVFSTSPSELSAIHCDGLALLPSIFRPEDTAPVNHPDLAGRMRYGGHALYIWQDLSQDADELKSRSPA